MNLCMPQDRHSSSEPLTSHVTGYVFEYIRKNALRRGDSLPSEVRTSAELNVSRSIVREAFRSLEVSGIIEKGNGRSPRVGSVNGDFLARLLQHALSTQQMSFEHVLDVRTALEVKACELAAVLRTEADVQQLRAAVKGMKRAGATADEFVQHDLAFHRVLNAASENLLLKVLGSAIHEAARQTMFLGLQARRKRSEILAIVATHQDIADAVEKGDAKAAGVAMRRHFSEALHGFRKAQQGFDL